MANITYTKNLKLRVDSNLTANAKFNLSQLDALGGTFLVDTTDSLRIRSLTNIYIQPNDASVGGSGVGGSVIIGNPNQPVELDCYVTELLVSSNLALLDQATGGNKLLHISYKSDLAALDTASDRNLQISLAGANRQLVLGANFSVSGSPLVLNTTGATSVTLPLTGVLATLSNSETFTNKFIDAGSNTLSNIANASISPTAAIAYSKLNLAGQIQNSDLSPSAGISYSKLNLANSILNSDINSAAAIAYSKLNLAASLRDSDVASGAAIAGTKIAATFGNQDLQTNARLRLDLGGHSTFLAPAQSGQVTDLQFNLPDSSGLGGQLLQTDGAGNLSWVSAGGTGTVTSVGLSMPAEFSVSNSPIVGAGTIAVSKSDQSANTVFAGPTSGIAMPPTFRSLGMTDLPATVANTSLTNLAFSGSNGQVLTLGGGVPFWASPAAQPAFFAANWVTGDGTTKVVTHNLGTLDVIIQIYDKTDGTTIQVDSVARTDINTTTLMSSAAPGAAGWRVLIMTL